MTLCQLSNTNLTARTGIIWENFGVTGSATILGSARTYSTVVPEHVSTLRFHECTNERTSTAHQLTTYGGGECRNLDYIIHSRLFFSETHARRNRPIMPSVANGGVHNRDTPCNKGTKPSNGLRNRKPYSNRCSSALCEQIIADNRPCTHIHGGRRR